MHCIRGKFEIHAMHIKCTKAKVYNKIYRINRKYIKLIYSTFIGFIDALTVYILKSLINN